MTTASERWQARMAGEEVQALVLEHFDSCTRDAYGRAVLFFKETGDIRVYFEDLIAYASGLQNGTVRETGFKCQCLSLRLVSAENRLTSANRVFRAHMTDENAQRVKDLEAEVAGLRGMK